MPSPLSSTTRVCSLLQSTGSPMTSTSTKGSMICAEDRVMPGQAGPASAPPGALLPPRGPLASSRAAWGAAVR